MIIGASCVPSAGPTCCCCSTAVGAGLRGFALHLRSVLRREKSCIEICFWFECGAEYGKGTDRAGSLTQLVLAQGSRNRVGADTPTGRSHRAAPPAHVQ